MVQLEMVYDFIHQLGFENLINKTVATCLYTGIVTDSGSFRFSKTTSKTHKCVADLIERGINNTEIHNLLFLIILLTIVCYCWEKHFKT